MNHDARFSEAAAILRRGEAPSSDLVPSREEARLRLTCSAMAGRLAYAPTASESLAKWSVEDADACLALLYSPHEGDATKEQMERLRRAACTCPPGTIGHYESCPLMIAAKPVPAQEPTP